MMYLVHYLNNMKYFIIYVIMIYTDANSIICIPGSIPDIIYNLRNTDYKRCMLCKSGYYTFKNDNTECLKCPVGKWSNPGSKECLSCIPGKYNDKPAMKECIQCPAGKWNNKFNSTYCIGKSCKIFKRGTDGSIKPNKCISCKDRIISGIGFLILCIIVEVCLFIFIFPITKTKIVGGCKHCELIIAFWILVIFTIINFFLLCKPALTILCIYVKYPKYKDVNIYIVNLGYFIFAVECILSIIYIIKRIIKNKVLPT